MAKWIEYVKTNINPLGIAILQYLVFVYYFTYSNWLINTDLLLVIAFGIICCLTANYFATEKMRASKCLMFSCLGAFWLFLAATVNDSGMGSAMTQTCLLLAISLFLVLPLTEREKEKITLRMICILSAILLLYSVQGGKIGVYKSGYYQPIFHFMKGETEINANCIAILFIFLAIYVFKYLDKLLIPKKWKRISQVVFSIGILYFLLETEARTSFMVAIVLLVLMAFTKNKELKGGDTLYFICLFLSLFIVFNYLMLYWLGFLDNFNLLGKSFFTGRQNIWAEAIERFNDNMLFGYSNKTTFTTKGKLSTHNALLAVLSYFGGIGLIIHVLVLCYAFKVLNKRSNRIICMALLALTMLMAFETLIADWNTIWLFAFLFIPSIEKERGKYDTQSHSLLLVWWKAAEQIR